MAIDPMIDMIHLMSLQETMIHGRSALCRHVPVKVVVVLVLLGQADPRR